MFKRSLKTFLSLCYDERKLISWQVWTLAERKNETRSAEEAETEEQENLDNSSGIPRSNVTYSYEQLKTSENLLPGIDQKRREVSFSLHIVNLNSWFESILSYILLLGLWCCSGLSVRWWIRICIWNDKTSILCDAKMETKHAEKESKFVLDLIFYNGCMTSFVQLSPNPLICWVFVGTPYLDSYTHHFAVSLQRGKLWLVWLLIVNLWCCR